MPMTTAISLLHTRYPFVSLISYSFEDAGAGAASAEALSASAAWSSPSDTWGSIGDGFANKSAVLTPFNHGAGMHSLS